MLDSFFNAIFGGLVEWSIPGSLLLISFIITSITTLTYKFTTDQNWVRETKQQMKSLQNEMKACGQDTKKAMELQKELMEMNMKFMMHSFKPLLYTFLPLLIVFSWMRGTYGEAGKILFGLSWIWVYIISSMIYSTLLRKVLKIH